MKAHSCIENCRPGIFIWCSAIRIWHLTKKWQMVLWYCCEFSFLFLLALIWNITMFFFRQVCWLGWCGARETWEDTWGVIVKCAKLCFLGRQSSYTKTERLSSIPCLKSCIHNALILTGLPFLTWQWFQGIIWADTPFSYKVNKIQLYHSELLPFMYITEMMYICFSSVISWGH